MDQLKEMWQKVVDYFNSNVWNIVIFFAGLAIGIIVIWLIMVILKAIFRRRNMDKVASRFICDIVRFVLWLFLILGLLAVMGVPITGLTTALSAIILAVGMALKENISNLANGIILVSSKKYKTGDLIIVGSVEGYIKEINFLFTTLKTTDGKQVLMPNNTMVNSQVTNLFANDKRRVQLTISVCYESDVELVKKVITDVMKSNGKVYLDPAPFCRLKNFAPSGLEFFCHCWCDREDYWDVYYYVTENIFNELKRNGLHIPYQQIEVRQRTDTPARIVVGDGLPERVEKKRDNRRKKATLLDFESEDVLKVIKSETERAKEESARKAKAKKAKKAQKAKEKAAKKKKDNESN